MPRFSVLMPTFNDAATIGDALASVPTRVAGERIEVVVADGGSTDGTLDLLAQYSDARLLRGPDQGIYDGLDRALRAASGQYVVHLNADDLIEATALERIAPLVFRDVPDVVSCRADVVEEDGEAQLRTLRTYDEETSDLRIEDVARGNPVVNARVIRRQYLLGIGGYDASYRIAGDREMMLRVLLGSPRHVVMDQLLYHYRRHPSSLTFGIDRAPDEFIREHLRIVSRHLDGVPRAVAHELRRWRAREVAQRVRLHATNRPGTAARWLWDGLNADLALPYWYLSHRRHPYG